MKTTIQSKSVFKRTKYIEKDNKVIRHITNELRFSCDDSDESHKE